ncbi:ethanolamine ammonia-lyase subunit EutB [Polaribacter sargassicola]|uniref:ethanolamine ammonia-lyase subunit EutB n=1 Tax=Polaribacter sargassicola TaxID=2836891 RepID=UPI001F35A661|nr:ethanolamine ammonia-lyase subunit EutB [Polaribacter sp. DS7-9]MCG1036752.1 ethanolamine ammonia-lyase subunit EutB [Polaribacter sp. DS7-9]
MTRKDFIKQSGMLGSALLVLNGCNFFDSEKEKNLIKLSENPIKKPKIGEDVFSYINREKGAFDNTLYKQILGAANEFKEGDKTLQIAAIDSKSRENARTLLANTTLKDLNNHIVYSDELLKLIEQSIKPNKEIETWTLQELKDFTLTKSEEEIKEIMPCISSDIIACLVKLMSNEELITIGKKVFNPLPNSKIGSKGYMGARVQPNSPTDNIEDISWQVFNAWSFAVGDVVLGTNPVSSDVKSVANIENALFDIISTFNLEETIPNCVLSHVDVQAEVEQQELANTGIWFQSIAGTVNANKTFDVTIEKMLQYAAERDGYFGFYAETGQGADLTNGHAEGFDMVMHEARKYGFLRVLKQKINTLKKDNNSWVHVNDVAGFIGPEVFRTKEQLVRCCLEDTVMGKLHGLTIGLDICSTLHMDVNLEDLDWCIEQVMPANPAYLMALPTKNDPMLSYLTTAFSNHIKIREQFKYKVNDAMWNFFKKLEIIDKNGNPTEHFGDPIWVYSKYLQAKNDKRSLKEIYKEGKNAIARIEKRGVPIAQGYGTNYWDLKPKLAEKVQYLYDDAKVSLWTEIDTTFIKKIPTSIAISTESKDRKDYVYHPESGEKLTLNALERIKSIKNNWQKETPDVQIIISDGLNARALMDEGHVLPFLDGLVDHLQEKKYITSKQHIVVKNGRVRAGYACGEVLFENKTTEKNHAVIHIIGERPGSGHHNFSAYLTVASSSVWSTKGSVDHNISRVVSGISDTSLNLKDAILDTTKILDELFTNQQ